MLTEQEIQAQITQLEASLASGVTAVSSDGESVSFDPAAIRQRIAELKALLPGKRHRQRRVRTFDLRNAF